MATRHSQLNVCAFPTHFHFSYNFFIWKTLLSSCRLIRLFESFHGFNVLALRAFSSFFLFLFGPYIWQPQLHLIFAPYFIASHLLFLSRRHRRKRKFRIEREREANKRKQIFERTTKMGKLISWGKRKGFWMMSSTDARSLLVFSPFIFRSLKMQLKISQKTAYYSFCQGTINQSNANTVQISNRFSCAFFFSRWKIEVDRVCHVWLIFFHRYVRFESSDRIIFSDVFFFALVF